MNFSISLLFAAFSFVFCEKCSETLRETFKKGFNLTESCDGCVVLSPGISSHGENWQGFCIGDEFFLFKNYKCREGNDFLIKPDSLAVVTNESCELTEGNHNLDENCFKKFNAGFCNETEILNDETSESVTLFHRWSTRVKSTAKTTETTRTKWTSEETEETSAKTTSTEETSETTRTEITKFITFLSTGGTTSPTATPTSSDFTPTTEFPKDRENLCEFNEFFFKDHCYFMLKGWKSHFDSKRNKKLYEENIKRDVVSLDTLTITQSCKNRHPDALGLAVETEEENKAVLKFLRTFHFYENCTIFTSGLRKNGENLWMDWNLKINHSILILNESDSQLLEALYCINACQSYWYLLHPSAVHLIDLTYFVICERPYNPRNILPELQAQCIKLYRNSGCYNEEKHSEYCCEKDEKGELWFACLNNSTRKTIKTKVSYYECLWTCGKKGFFRDRPVCNGFLNCDESYNEIKYSAPSGRYAIGNCPPGFRGYSTWYCGGDRNFVGKPDWSLCCLDTTPCRNTDIFLNVWAGCPSRTVVKKTDCPPGSYLKEALVKWQCQENGNFSGATPDYSKCNITAASCKKTDRYGTEWEAALGTISDKACPPGFTGRCYWECKQNGVFDGPEPDCSKCRATWMEDIDKKIKNHSSHVEVMNIMENYTKKEDIRIGYGHVLKLTNDCVSLFKNQTSQSQVTIFDNFLKSYSRILKNVAGNPNVWSSFSESNREEFSDEILKTTQNAAFAKLESENVSKTKYNATLAKSKTDGFDFFVAYNLSIGSQFPLEKFSEKDWHLHVKGFNEGDTTFAAMGLVMNYTLSSLMFPQENGTNDLKMNAPAVTFKIATFKNGEVLLQPNVTFAISFKHTNQTRFPSTRVIKRKLHVGEEPSGVFNSTSCYYYKDSQWTTEGCFVTFTSKERTNCTCNHLSTIGLLMTIHEYRPNETLEVVSTISSGVTIVSLILALLVFYYFDTVKNDRVLISQNLCFCLLIGHTMLVTVMDKKFFNIPDGFCTAYAIILHYVFMAAFAWMLVEGCHLYRMLVLVFDSNVEYRWIYIFIGYGAPFIVVVTTQVIGLIIKEQPYGQDELCWLRPPKYVWAFTGPVLVITLRTSSIAACMAYCTPLLIIIPIAHHSCTPYQLNWMVNFCILIIAMKLAISSKRRCEKSNFATLKLWIKGWITLSSLLGITWLFGFFYIHQNELFAYTFVVFNGLQGFFIFLFRCVLSEHYQNILLKKIKHLFFISRSKSHKKSENAKTETKMYAVSQTKSLSGEMEGRDSGYDPGLDRSEDKKHSNPKSKPDVEINVILKPEVSEAYLRNKMIARNFSIRKSKTTWLGDNDDFPELSYHDCYSPN